MNTLYNRSPALLSIQLAVQADASNEHETSDADTITR